MNYRSIHIMILAITIGALVINLTQSGLLNWVNLLLIIILSLCLYLRYTNKKLIDKLANASNFTNENGSIQEMAQHLAKVDSFNKESRIVIENVTEIGQDSFSGVINKLINSELKEPLLVANNKIIDLRKKESESNWITQGIAMLSELKQRENNLEEYCNLVIATIVKYIRANQGSFFIIKKDETEAYFQLIAAYAYDKRKYLEKRIEIGEGLIGQIYYEKEILYLTEVPKDYIKITSGLGESLPRCICIIPLLFENNVYGAIELASFHKLEKYEMEYLSKIAEQLSYTLHNIETHQHTEYLLTESQKMAQEVKAQEEELRQNMEELTSTQEEMSRKQVEMDAVMSSLSTVELDLDGKITRANEIFLGITGYQENDIVGRLYKTLIPQHGNDPIQYEMMWQSILSGRSFSGEFRIVNNSNKEMWMAGNFTPIISSSGRPYKVMVISLFTTQDKEKLFELQEMITAIKNCIPIAELTPQATFKTANDLFLVELGIKRIDLKRTQLSQLFCSETYETIRSYAESNDATMKELELEVNLRDNEIRKYNASLIKIVGDARNKCLLVVKNQIDEWKQVSL